MFRLSIRDRSGRCPRRKSLLYDLACFRTLRRFTAMGSSPFLSLKTPKREQANKVACSLFGDPYNTYSELFYLIEITFNILFFAYRAKAVWHGHQTSQLGKFARYTNIKIYLKESSDYNLALFLMQIFLSSAKPNVDLFIPYFHCKATDSACAVYALPKGKIKKLEVSKNEHRF